MMENEPKLGDLRIWWIPQVGMEGEPFYVSVKTPVEGKFILDTLAYYDLYQFEKNVKPDYANAGGLEILEDGLDGGLEWCDWQSSDGWDIESIEWGDEVDGQRFER
jgi:hypothetical protein